MLRIHVALSAGTGFAWPFFRSILACARKINKIWKLQLAAENFTRESVLDVEARSRIHIQTPNFIYSIISLAFHFATSTSARTRPCKLVFATLTFSFCITIHPVLRVLLNDVIDVKKKKKKERKERKKEKKEKRKGEKIDRVRTFSRDTHTRTHTHACAHTARYMICRTETTFFFPAVSAIDSKGKRRGRVNERIRRSNCQTIDRSPIPVTLRCVSQFRPGASWIPNGPATTPTRSRNTGWHRDPFPSLRNRRYNTRSHAPRLFINQ